MEYVITAMHNAVLWNIDKTRPLKLPKEVVARQLLYVSQLERPRVINGIEQFVCHGELKHALFRPPPWQWIRLSLRT